MYAILEFPYRILLFGEGGGGGGGNDDDYDDDDDDDDNNNNNNNLNSPSNNAGILSQLELKLNSINYYGCAV
jgi:hypothetical protein